ncbi:MAG: DUF4430 domain-containing protein [Clostridia bacterium]|nr:DUF4430 domain-containing protein [Clostridia bacterium]
MNSNVKKTILISFIGFLLVGVMLLVYGLCLPKTDNGEKKLTLEIKYANVTYTYEDLTTNKGTVLEFLQEYDDLLELSLVTENGAYGEYLTALKGTAQDDANGYYYTFKMDGVYANYGVSTQSLTKDDGSYYSKITFEYGVQVYDSNWATLSTTLANGGDGSITQTPANQSATVFYIIAGILLVVAVGEMVYFIIAKRKKNA